MDSTNFKYRSKSGKCKSVTVCASIDMIRAAVICGNIKVCMFAIGQYKITSTDVRAHYILRSEFGLALLNIIIEYS